MTIGNALVLMAVVHGYATWSFKLPFKRDVTEGLHRMRIIRSDLLKETDLHGLPDPVQKYLRYTGVVNKPKVHNVRILSKAVMRNKEKDWFGMISVQYHFFDRSERLFFLNAFISGLPASGYYRYKNGRASMVVKLWSLFPVVKAEGEALFRAETVTAFNDMCVFAPASLLLPYPILQSGFLEPGHLHRTAIGCFSDFFFMTKRPAPSFSTALSPGYSKTSGQRSTRSPKLRNLPLFKLF